ncbi:phosphoglycerate mutase-like protein [Ceratobasidium sp. AG-I]|nr:phosphoglycerate mutase-like protein [Ceratobasidium sp. AG-I]
MITVTFVRHGESTDNLKSAWAGWADAPLSNHGLNQAKAVGEHFSTYPITHMFASDLKRAHTTALAIHSGQPDPKPPLTVTQLIREQHFGEAEGKPWMGGQGQTQWAQPAGRDGRFKDGESLDDVGRRGDEFFEKFLAPLVKQAAGKKAGEVNVVVVSHGIAIAETLGSLVRHSVHVNNDGRGGGFRGLHNTAWTRILIGLEDEDLDDSTTPTTLGTNPRTTPDPSAILATEVEKAAPPPTECEEVGAPSIRMKVIACNQHTHLQGVVYTPPGCGSPERRKCQFSGG